MKKLLLIPLICLSLVGCAQPTLNVGAKDTKEWEKAGKEYLKLKSDKILSSKKIVKYKKQKVLSFGSATSTASTTKKDITEIVIDESYIEYDYVSDVITSKKPYFTKDKFANAEILDKNSIAFYSEDWWYKDGDVIYEIVKGATTTEEAFKDQTKLSLLEKAKNLILPTANAVETYNSSGTYTPPSAGTVEYLIVAGGGGGGGDRAAGGGGGEFSTGEVEVTVQEYTVTVGLGGDGAVISTSNPTNGGDSSFGGVTATGGGSGASANPSVVSAGDGGNGGGGFGQDLGNITGGTGDPGFDGGDGFGPGTYGSGGGGGAAEEGDDGVNGQSGKGGDGLPSSLSGSEVYYSGGGGASKTNFGSTHGAGGLGGGGDGGTSDGEDGEDGDANTGGGGGGGANNPSAGGGKGGSGIVILSFTAAPTPSTEIRDDTLFFKQ